MTQLLTTRGESPVSVSVLLPQVTGDPEEALTLAFQEGRWEKTPSRVARYLIPSSVCGLQSAHKEGLS